jgi:predicted NAD-dependent protein-ADP-ribosyltransferase YbiA (DUF1768 family)
MTSVMLQLPARKEDPKVTQSFVDTFVLDDDGNVKVKAGHGHSVVLSNKFQHPNLRIPYLGVVFNSVETAYQYAKFACYDDSQSVALRGKVVWVDPFEFTEELVCTTSADDAKGVIGGKGNSSKRLYATCKSVGHKMTLKQSKCEYDKCQAVWIGRSEQVMKELIGLKFSALNPEFVACLLATGDRIVYETRFKGGTIWERSKTGWGLFSKLIMERRFYLNRVVRASQDIPRTS